MINKIDKKYKEYFDQAFCLEVSEYWFDPITALRNINSLLKRSGILWISFSFLYPIHNPIGQDMLRYTEWGVKRLLRETGFEIVSFEQRVMTIDGYKEWVKFIAQEQMRPSKDYGEHNATGCLCICRKIK